MAEVYEVEEPASGEHLALKRLIQTGVALKRFNREYETMTRLNHPNIVRVYHYGIDGEMPWMTMELIDGTPVQAYAKQLGRPNNPSRQGEVMRCALEIAHALDHIHRRGLYHRDLKSANVLVLPDGRVKLVDFGAARLRDPIETITRDGEFVGTFAYASPEQLNGDPIDHRSDLYSLGILLYRLTTGKRPFNATDPHSLAQQHINAIPKLPREIVPTIPKEIQRIIMWLLEKHVDSRPESATTVVRTLRQQLSLAPPAIGPKEIYVSSEHLVGREEQIAQLRTFLSVCRPASVALVVGTQGSGRQTVMRAIEKESRDQQFKVYSSFFRRDTDDIEPLATMLLTIGKAVDTPTKGLRQALDQVANVAWATTFSNAYRSETLRQAAQLLFPERGATDPTPIVIMLRALQNAGPTGFEVLVGLRKLVQQLQPPVMFIADCSETADDPKSLSRMRLPDAFRVSLPPLTVQQVALLVGRLLHRRPPPHLVAHRIHKASGGLPAFVEEVVKSMVGEGALRVEGRDVNRMEWAALPYLEIPVPPGANRRVLGALSALPADRRRLLEALAIAGGDTSLKVLAGALERTVREIRPAVDDLCHRGWTELVYTQGTDLRWRQLLVEQVIIEHLSPPRRDVLRQLLVTQLIDAPPFDTQIQLLLEVGRIDEAVGRAIVWGRRHIDQNRPATALRVLDPIIANLAQEQSVSEEDKGQLYLLHAIASLLARPADARTTESFKKADELSAAAGDLFRAEVQITRARLQQSVGDYQAYRRHLMSAWDLAAPHPPCRLSSQIATRLGQVQSMFGLLDESASWHGRSRRIASSRHDYLVLAHANVGVASWQFAKGVIADARRTATESIAVFQQEQDARGLSLAIPIWVNCQRLEGRFSEALAVLYQELPRMRTAEAPSFYVRLLLSTAWCEMDLERLGRAQECVDELAAAVRSDEHLHLRLESMLVWGRILLTSDNLEEALEVLNEVAQYAISSGLVVMGALANSLRAETLWKLDQKEEAKPLFDEALGLLQRCGDLSTTLAATIALARAAAVDISAEEIFQPLNSFLTAQPNDVGRLEKLLAQLRYDQHRGMNISQLKHEALAVFETICSRLNNTDRAIMRIHPWSRQLGQGS
ncbi:MAG: protein kinase [Proteobacteria bacterium]|nr:protein kinase [Pseudomonadota bacterium]